MALFRCGAGADKLPMVMGGAQGAVAYIYVDGHGLKNAQDSAGTITYQGYTITRPSGTDHINLTCPEDCTVNIILANPSTGVVTSETTMNMTANVSQQIGTGDPSHSVIFYRFK